MQMLPQFVRHLWSEWAAVQCSQAHVQESTEPTADADWAHGQMLLFIRHNIKLGWLKWTERHLTRITFWVCLKDVKFVFSLSLKFALRSLKFKLNSNFVYVLDLKLHEVSFVHFPQHPWSVIDHPSRALLGLPVYTMCSCSCAEVVIWREQGWQDRRVRQYRFSNTSFTMYFKCIADVSVSKLNPKQYWPKRPTVHRSIDWHPSQSPTHWLVSCGDYFSVLHLPRVSSRPGHGLNLKAIQEVLEVLDIWDLGLDTYGLGLEVWPCVKTMILQM